MSRIEPSAWVEELSDEEIEAEAIEVPRITDISPEPPVAQKDRVGGVAPPESLAIPSPAADREPVAAETRKKRWSEATPADRPIGVGPLKTEYPSARAIFAAQGRRAQPAPVVSSSRRRRSVEPMPTECRAPSQWTLPLWLGWLPTLFATLLLGTVGTWLAYEWMNEAGGSNVGLRLALRPDSPSSPLIDPSLIPQGGWFFSTPTHMAAWAVALERANDGENHAEDVRLLIAAARQASPLASRARFHVEASQPSASPIDPNDFSAIGRTRDVVSLIGTGGRLREAGKLESSIRAYRSAMELALMAAREGLEPPVFDENNEVRRYSLPHEALVGLVVRDMAERGDWTTEQWTSALPPSASATWVASKVLARMRKKAVADALADLAIRQAEILPPPGYDPAEHRAAVAEALAYRGRWTDSAEQYRQAIDQVEDDTTRRSWWFNLAELAHRMSDDAAQASALEASKSPDLADEITQRARKALESQPGLLAPTPRRSSTRSYITTQ
jgi:tetratricopeptide (TPR) repeat protein